MIAIVVIPAALLLSACGHDAASDPTVLRAGQLDIKLPPGWKVTEGGAVRPASATKTKAGATAADATPAADSGDTVPLAKDDPSTAFFKSSQRFQQCLKDTGTTFRGAPDASNPSAPSNDPAYIKSLTTCAAKSGIVQALADMKKSQDNMSAADIEKQNKGYLKWRTCMIGRGWSIGEPTPDSKGRLFSFTGGKGPQITPPPGKDLLGGQDMSDCATASQK